MKQASVHPGLLRASQRRQIERLVFHTEIMPFSCVLWTLERERFHRPQRVLPDDMIFVPTTARVVYRVGDASQEIGPGELVFVPAEIEFGQQFADDAESAAGYALHLHAADDKHESIFASLKSPFGSISPPEVWFKRLAVCAHLLGQSPELGVEYARQLIRDMLVEQVISGAGLRKPERAMDPRITDAHNQIRLRFASDLRVADLARNAGLSTARFRQLFHEAIGLSPKACLQKLRLTSARALLKTNPHLTVQEVAYRVGFNDPHNFHKLYRETYGETPRGTQMTETDNYGTTEDGRRKTENGIRRKDAGKRKDGKIARR